MDRMDLIPGWDQKKSLTSSSDASVSVIGEPVCRSFRRRGSLRRRQFEVHPGSHDRSSCTGGRDYCYYRWGRLDGSPPPHVAVPKPSLLVTEVYQQMLMYGMR